MRTRTLFLKTVVITVCTLFVVITSFAQTGTSEVLNNYSILNMAKKGLGDAIIISKIKQSSCQFDVSTDALVFLKESKVSDPVIAVMLEKSRSGSAATPTYVSQTDKQATTGDKSSKPLQPKYAHEVEQVLPNLFESGIFYFNPDENVYNKLDATVVTSHKAGGFGQALASSMTGGLANVKTKSALDGEEANLQAKERNPVFYFYFDQAKSSLNNSNNKAEEGSNDYMSLLFRSMANGADNSVAMSPNDFKLIKLSTTKNSRYFNSGKQNAYQVSSGIDSKQVVSFKYERLTNTLFKVTFPEEVENGEYCFFYAGNSNRQSSLGNFYQVNAVKVFDFGVSAEKKKR